MIKKISHSLVAVMIMISGVLSLSLITPQTAYAASGCNARFLGFPTWYNGLTDGGCNIKSPGPSGKNGVNLSEFIWRIVLNIIEIALVFVAYASAGYIIYGGFRYLTSTGFPDKVTSAKKIIQHAVIGLVLSFMSIAIVNMVTNFF